ncbi:hypothetical protein MAPG_03451 [Magnaporthiopsis poae ATCC 64411]|uniref:Uncharacterized protein n=1 Tax=Magnaporthiopsis poae (strain ATCC 64411 / 73-15) TaxID=644358 RepID=A0A0C4DU17_MAGP6|nr:hypothetical protein MAPG_03451 [Magnaporthiopsis poae ATCC 64411]
MNPSPDGPGESPPHMNPVVALGFVEVDVKSLRRLAVDVEDYVDTRDPKGRTSVAVAVKLLLPASSSALASRLFELANRRLDVFGLLREHLPRLLDKGARHQTPLPGVLGHGRPGRPELKEDSSMEGRGSPWRGHAWRDAEACWEMYGAIVAAWAGVVSAPGGALMGKKVGWTILVATYSRGLLPADAWSRWRR